MVPVQQRYRPFGAGSGDRIRADFGLPHLVQFPILADLSAAGDGAAFPPRCRASMLYLLTRS